MEKQSGFSSFAGFLTGVAAVLVALAAAYYLWDRARKKVTLFEEMEP